MSFFVLNILLALLWTLVWGAFDMYTFVGGFLIGYVLLGLYSRAVGGDYGLKAWRLLSFANYFLRTLIRANLQIAWEVLTPTHHQTPRIIRYGIEGLTDLQITSLANAISLTPGTLSIDVSADRKFLYIHSMYARDRQAAERDIHELRQRLMREVFS